MLLNGNQAIVSGALAAGLKFFAGYPITPASDIMHQLSKEKSIKFIHAEDEIAAINMAIGASLAGKKSMTATSGPGFSLMQEAIGYAHMVQIPLVITDVQRIGPSTGMPTLGAQGDIMQSKYGSHGDYYPIVFSPNSVEECFYYTIQAFNAAEESLSPVILLSDGYLANLYETTNLEKAKLAIKSRALRPLGASTRHFTGLLSKDGILRTKDLNYYYEFINKLKTKTETIAKNYEFYEYKKNKNSDTLLISYGISSRAIASSKYSIFRPIRLFPVIEKLKQIAENYKKIIVIEMNNGQYVKEIQSLLNREIKFISTLRKLGEPLGL